MASFRDFVRDLSGKIGLEIPPRWNQLSEIQLAQRFLERLNEYFFQTHESIGNTTFDGEEFPYFSEFHKFWEAHHKEVLNARINRKQAAIVARCLRDAVRQYGEDILRVTHNTHGLNARALSQVRFFSANQDFRSPPENQFKIYLDDPSRFDAQEIVDDPVAFLGFMGLARLSQSDKRADYAGNAAKFLLDHDITAFDIAATFGNDSARIREAIVNTPNMGYGMKKANMFIRDMHAWNVWPNLRNFEVVDVASDRNTMKVALRARILETDIPLLSSFLDIFCHQYGYIDEMNAQAWRAVWEEWRRLDAAAAPASPCLIDFVVYRLGREYCKQMAGHYRCETGRHDFYQFGNRLERRACLVCSRQRPRQRHAAHLTDYVLPCQIPPDRLPRDEDGNLLLDSDNLLYLFGGVCIFETACRPKDATFKMLVAPRSISIKGQTGWTQAYSDRAEGGGGLMS
jgi:hypothetical protein